MKSKTKAKRLLKNIASNWQAYVLILPAFITTTLFHYVPIYGLQIAFKNFKSSIGIWGSRWVGMKHFYSILSTMDMRIITNTLSISLYSIAVFPLAVIFAFMLDEVRHAKFKKTVQMISYAPHFISTVVIVSVIQCFFKRSNGLVNNVIALFGGERIDFLGIPEYFASIFVWSDLWQNLGWDAIIYIASLAGVSRDLIESANIDGANRLQIIWHIKLPHILPTAVTLLILRTGSVLNVGFEKVFLMQNSLNLSASRVLSTYIYDMGIKNARFDYATALGLFNNVVNLVVLILVNALAKKIAKTGLF